MTQINDGGPAFPIPQQQFTDGHMIVSSQGHDGMSLRDWMAGRVLSEVYNHLKHSRPKDIAELSYELADAMLKAREAKP